jgi:uncharacterized protein
MENYEFIDRTLFFPKQGILVIGDLHIGYEAMLRQSGVLIPERQIKDIIKDLKNIFKEIKNRGFDLKKIVFIGDIKHAFYFQHKEANEFQEVIQFLGSTLPQENITIIKGNHDTIDYTFEGVMKPYHIEGDIAFVHGHKPVEEVFEKNIKTIVMGHLHPCVILESGAKKEAYKCFLDGIYNGKNIIIMPSFLDFIEGTPVNDYNEDYIESFSIIPKKAILNFKIHAIGKDEIYEFGKIKDL